MKAETAAPAAEFTQRFSATRRGARLARHLAVHQLDGWGIPYGSDLSDSAALIVAELAANAVTHARVPGRDFELRLALGPTTLRIEVRTPEVTANRPRNRRHPTRRRAAASSLSTHWGVADRVIVKTVWAELPLGQGRWSCAPA